MAQFLVTRGFNPEKENFCKCKSRSGKSGTIMYDTKCCQEYLIDVCGDCHLIVEGSCQIFTTDDEEL